MNHSNLVEMFERVFTVEKTPNFLFFKVEEDLRMLFTLDTNPEEISWGEVMHYLKDMETEDRLMPLPYVALASQNRVAQKCRRAAGNMFFANGELCAEISTHQMQMEHHYFSQARRIPVIDFEPSLLITTYFVVDRWKEGKTPDQIAQAKVSVVDGPLAVFEGKLYANQNWRKYFHKTLVA